MGTQHLALTVFMLLLALGILIAILICIFIKRKVSRSKAHIWKNPFTPIGSGFSKAVKKEIYRRLNSSINLHHEPYVFTSEYVENWDSYARNDQQTFQFRMLAMKRFSQLQEAIVRHDAKNTVGTDVRTFLRAVETSLLKFCATEKIDEYSQLYNWARFDLKTFDVRAYEKFCQIQENLMASVTKYRSVEVTNENPSQSHHFHEDLHQAVSASAFNTVGTSGTGGVSSHGISKTHKRYRSSGASVSSSEDSMAAPLITGDDDMLPGSSSFTNPRHRTKERSGKSELVFSEKIPSNAVDTRQMRVYYRTEKEPSEVKDTGIENQGVHC